MTCGVVLSSIWVVSSGFLLVLLLYLLFGSAIIVLGAFGPLADRLIGLRCSTSYIDALYPNGGPYYRLCSIVKRAHNDAGATPLT